MARARPRILGPLLNKGLFVVCSITRSCLFKKLDIAKVRVTDIQKATLEKRMRRFNIVRDAMKPDPERSCRVHDSVIGAIRLLSSPEPIDSVSETFLFWIVQLIDLYPAA